MVRCHERVSNRDFAGWLTILWENQLFEWIIAHFQLTLLLDQEIVSVMVAVTA